jgi:Ni/Fe-hydrogenase subunit HybB-like protein
MTTQAQPVGGPLFTRTFKVLLALVGLMGVVVAWRAFAGLGAATALNDGYPWGLWIAFDVVTGTALACGGYAVALLVYILNKGRYHPLVRPALLTSALGYTLAGFSVFVDIGRPWLAWKLPLQFWNWNGNSILLEVALCIMAYTVVLWIELMPAFLEKWHDSPRPRLRGFAVRATPVLEKALLWIVALGLLLPTMHQSSLGSMMLLAGPRLHPFWNTPWLPFLFLVSCLAMGYAAVIFESTLSSHFFRRPRETAMLSALSGAMVWVLAGFGAFRLVEIALRGELGRLASVNRFTLFFVAEMALVAIPLAILSSRGRRANPRTLFQAALLLMLGGGLYRFDTYLVAFRPGEHWAYFPAVPELLFTVGIVALEIAAYIAIVKTFPILRGRASVPPQAAAAAA